MDSVINDERDCVAIFGFDNTLILTKFEMMCCYIQINLNTFTILSPNPKIVLSTNISLIGRKIEIL
jgi:hypothetical protein